jgi:hypothetical protein
MLLPFAQTFGYREIEIEREKDRKIDAEEDREMDLSFAQIFGERESEREREKEID